MDIFKSKKFIVALVTAFVSVLIVAVPALVEYQDALVGILSMAAVYIFSQGLADFGKEGMRGR